MRPVPSSRNWLALLCALAASSAGLVFAGSASAYTMSYCNTNWPAAGDCPSTHGSSHPRHTLSDNYGQWGTSPHYSGCDVYVYEESYVAYTDSTASYPKYQKGGCNYIYQAYPGNTELLRPYVFHTNFGYSNYLHGDAAY
ncbi:MAG TPA: hypothetical protein VF587_07245 [Solirubrobacteraceae bacterium]|jgi:hypothetical protein